MSLAVAVHDGGGGGSTPPRFLGRLSIPVAAALGGAARGAPRRAWFVLGSEQSGLPDGVSVRGEVELVLRWRHNPLLCHEGEPLEEFDGDAHPGKEPNELRVGVIRVRHLRLRGGGNAGGDGALAPDPYVVVKVHRHSRTSTLRPRTVNPRFNWTCCVPVRAADYEPPLEPTPGKKKKDKKLPGSAASASAGEVRLAGIDAAIYLDVTVRDAGSHAFLGRALVPFIGGGGIGGGGLGDKRAQPMTVVLCAQPTGPVAIPAIPDQALGEVDLLLKWHYNAALDFSDLEAPYDPVADPNCDMPPNEVA
jgi:hypothetical protein